MLGPSSHTPNRSTSCTRTVASGGPPARRRSGASATKLESVASPPRSLHQRQPQTQTVPPTGELSVPAVEEGEVAVEEGQVAVEEGGGHGEVDSGHGEEGDAAEEEEEEEEEGGEEGGEEGEEEEEAEAAAAAEEEEEGDGFGWSVGSFSSLGLEEAEAVVAGGQRRWRGTRTEDSRATGWSGWRASTERRVMVPWAAAAVAASARPRRSLRRSGCRAVGPAMVAEGCLPACDPYGVTPLSANAKASDTMDFHRCKRSGCAS